MQSREMEATVRALIALGKGVLAADESFPTIEKRFKSIDLPSTEENRRAYRELLLSAPGIGAYISGVILFDETIRQQDASGTSFPEMLRRQGVIPGIKVDGGTAPLDNFPHEHITEGLDGLGLRLAEYYELGARFTKWRNVYTIGPGLPTSTAIAANAEILARSAAACQRAGLVPIVEPEVLMDGDHSLEECEAVTIRVHAALFAALRAHRVILELMLLKPNMVLPGEHGPRASVEEVAQATLRCLRQAVPAAVPGIVFLSGGQDPVLATRHLNAMNRIGSAPWVLSFSYARALQKPALERWQGKPD
ncbi:MAG: class I fructose-bisphosphate aldolase, partial [Armatimonadota bacterium]